MKFVAIKKWKTDGGETVIEYFSTMEQCLAWISKQPKDDSWEWYVGEYDLDG